MKLQYELHGMTHTKGHGRWKAMRRRCLTPSHSRYKDYGGRGITICERWLNSYQAYFDDVGEAPEGMSLDRIDNDGGYWCGKCGECTENNWPKNWRWATNYEQVLNRRNTTSARKKLGVPGVTITKNGLHQVQISIDKKQKYLGVYKNVKEASYVYFIANQIKTQNYFELVEVSKESNQMNRKSIDIAILLLMFGLFFAGLLASESPYQTILLIFVASIWLELSDKQRDDVQMEYKLKDDIKITKQGKGYDENTQEPEYYRYEIQTPQGTLVIPEDTFGTIFEPI